MPTAAGRVPGLDTSPLLLISADADPCKLQVTVRAGEGLALWVGELDWFSGSWLWPWVSRSCYRHVEHVGAVFLLFFLSTFNKRTLKRVGGVRMGTGIQPLRKEQGARVSDNPVQSKDLENGKSTMCWRGILWF